MADEYTRIYREQMNRQSRIARHEYEITRLQDNHALRQRVEAIESRELPRPIGAVIGGLLALPGLRGLWIMSSSGPTGSAYDISGQGRTLSPGGMGAISYGIDGLIPYAALDGAVYLGRADEAALDITGDLTLGGLFRFNNAAIAAEVLLAKWDASTNNRSYILFRDTAANDGHIIFRISADGSTVAEANSSITGAQNTWYFIIGRFTAGAEMKIWINGIAATNTVGIPASIYASNAALRLGATSAATPSWWFSGQAGLIFLCAFALPDRVIGTMFRDLRTLIAI